MIRIQFQWKLLHVHISSTFSPLWSNFFPLPPLFAFLSFFQLHLLFLPFLFFRQIFLCYFLLYFANFFFFSSCSTIFSSPVSFLCWCFSFLVSSFLLLFLKIPVTVGIPSSSPSPLWAHPYLSILSESLAVANRVSKSLGKNLKR